MKTLTELILFSALANCVLGILAPQHSTNSNGTALPKISKTDSYLDAFSNSRVDAEKSQNVVIVTAKDKNRVDRDDHSGYDYTPQNIAPVDFNPSDGFSSSGGSFSSNGGDYNSPSDSYGAPITPEPVYDSYSAPGQSYKPPSNTYLPSKDYGPPRPTYGPPVQSYGPPIAPYRPPVSSYGPPLYGPPSYRPAPLLKPSYGIPYGAPSFDFFDKISFKMDLLTVAKILLKLLIFKKIVKMIAVICLLLFIPKLIHWKKDNGSYGGSDEDMYRSFKVLGEDANLDKAVQRALQVYEEAKSCENSVTCRLDKVLDDFDERYPYSRISRAVYEATFKE